MVIDAIKEGEEHDDTTIENIIHEKQTLKPNIDDNFGFVNEP